MTTSLRKPGIVVLGVLTLGLSLLAVTEIYLSGEIDIPKTIVNWE